MGKNTTPSSRPKQIGNEKEKKLNDQKNAEQTPQDGKASIQRKRGGPNHLRNHVF